MLRVITHETGGTICYVHWVLRLVISHTRQGVRFVTGIGVTGIGFGQGYDLFQAFGPASYDIIHETGATICYRHCVLRLVISHTRQGVRFVTCLGFCVL